MEVQQKKRNAKRKTVRSRTLLPVCFFFEPSLFESRVLSPYLESRHCFACLSLKGKRDPEKKKLLRMANLVLRWSGVFQCRQVQRVGSDSGWAKRIGRGRLLLVGETCQSTSQGRRGDGQ